MFSKLELTGILSILHVTCIIPHALIDEDEYLNQASTQLGEIQIRIFRAQHLGTALLQPVSNSAGHGKVHERSKKAVTHCVSCVNRKYCSVRDI